MWRNSPFEEQPQAVLTQLIAILQQQTLMHALLRILRPTIRLRRERSNEQRVGRAWRDDVAVALDVALRGFEVPEGDLGETFEGGCHFGELVEVIGGGGGGFGGGGRGLGRAGVEDLDGGFF